MQILGIDSTGNGDPVHSESVAEPPITDIERHRVVSKTKIVYDEAESDQLSAMIASQSRSVPYKCTRARVSSTDIGTNTNVNKDSMYAHSQSE